MIWLRRLVRWLAREEIEHELLVMRAKERADCAFAVKLHAQSGYLEGYRQGTREAFDAIEKSIIERTGGPADFVTPEDLARAKKGMLH